MLIPFFNKSIYVVHNTSQEDTSKAIRRGNDSDHAFIKAFHQTIQVLGYDLLKSIATLKLEWPNIGIKKS